MMPYIPVNTTMVKGGGGGEVERAVLKIRGGNSSILFASTLYSLQ
jgi:hypothetical protein